MVGREFCTLIAWAEKAKGLQEAGRDCRKPWMLSLEVPQENE